MSSKPLKEPTKTNNNEISDEELEKELKGI